MSERPVVDDKPPIIHDALRWAVTVAILVCETLCKLVVTRVIIMVPTMSVVPVVVMVVEVVAWHREKGVKTDLIVIGFLVPFQGLL